MYRYMSAIDGFDNSSLFYVIVFMGVSYALLNGFGAFICFLSTDPIKRKLLRQQLMAYTSWIVGIALAALLTFMFIYQYTGSLDVIFSVSVFNLH